MSIVRKISEPTIKIKEIAILNKEEESGMRYDSGQHKIGLDSPYIVINNMNFFGNTVVSMNLTTDKFIPKLTVTLVDVNQRLKTDFLPIDDILSLYMKSDNTDFSDLRQDYRIVDYNHHGEKFTISAVLNVPELWVDRFYGFNGSVFDCLKDLASIMGLGFASNIESTNDAMYHICPNISLKDFIMEELMSVCYMNEKTFFICYIDQHYYLNLIEFNSLIKKDIEPPKSSAVSVNTEEFVNKDKEEVSLFISNHQSESGKANYLQRYNIINNAGKIGLQLGHRVNLIFYDKNAHKYKTLFLETTTTDGISANDVVIKGEMEEDHTKDSREIRLGSIFEDNVHKNYYLAKVGNKYNLNEMKKLSVMAELFGIDYGIYNYMSIPLEIMQQDQSYLDAESGEEDEGYNETLTGMYVTQGISYHYSREEGNRLHMKMKLIRREYYKKRIEENL